MIRTRGNSRSGALLICVLVCLLVASAMVTVTTGTALQARRNLRLQHQMRQTELLLDAGVLRAASQLQRSDQYEGETWNPESLIGFQNPVVEIRILNDEKPNDSILVEVVASLGTPAGPKQIQASLTRRSHTFSIQHTETSPTLDSSTAE